MYYCRHTYFLLKDLPASINSTGENYEKYCPKTGRNWVKKVRVFREVSMIISLPENFPDPLQFFLIETFYVELPEKAF